MHAMGIIARERVKLSNGLKAIVHWLVVFVKRTADRGITQFTLVSADVAGCVCFAKTNISEGQDECRKCDEKTPLTNKNTTVCIPFTYGYYQIVKKYILPLLPLSLQLLEVCITQWFYLSLWSTGKDL